MDSSNDQPHATATEDRVPWGQLIAYGAGGVIPIALFNIYGQLTQLLGNISLGLSAATLGFILIIPRVWDAVSDPIVGYFSDNTRSRWGRRRPYILIGGLAVAVSFVAMWWVPRGEWVEGHFASEGAYEWFQLAFILAAVLVFFTACTIFEIPHGALGMEMSPDYHERTRLFSAKSFFGNLFAMGTPWLLWLASREYFKGPGGDLVDGMRYVSLFIGAALIPLTWWWFHALTEPGFAVAKQQAKSSFLHDMQTTLGNKTFLSLVVIIFTLAMGFNFVSLFNFYITIFYLFDGSEANATWILGINGTVWAVTGVLAVFPLNWISRRWGKTYTLLLAILLMCAAQLSKIVCYDPQHPYLILLPTLLLSSGMLMFFTLGSSMVGDVCDEDELKTGTRSEGSYYSVFWWFIKMGTAFASFVTGVLLQLTYFDETQNKTANDLVGAVEVIKTEADNWAYINKLQTVQESLQRTISIAESEFDQWESEADATNKSIKQLRADLAAVQSLIDEQMPDNKNAIPRSDVLAEHFVKALKSGTALQSHFWSRDDKMPEITGHTHRLAENANALVLYLEHVQTQNNQLAADPVALLEESKQLSKQATQLKRQAPKTLLRLRVIEIGLPLVLSVVSILLTLRYPLTEERCYEIKEELKRRRGAMPVSDGQT